MSATYSRNMMKVSVGKMLQTIGWHSVNTTPLEILTDILIQYLTEMGKLTNDYTNECIGCTEPNLDHLGLVFREFHINLPDLEEYVTYVDFGQPPTQVPKYPIPKEDHLNFLKPGSKEVVTRPVYIHEHLPPMFAIQEANENENEMILKEEEPKDISSDSLAPVFKRPAEISPGDNFKRPRLILEEEGRPTREISSVMMTTSGYISPAREGKLPEARTPLASIDAIATVNTNAVPPNVASKPNRILKKVERRKDKMGRELFRALDDKIKTIRSMKDVTKLKQIKGVNPAAALSVQPTVNFCLSYDVKVTPMPNNTKLPLVNNKANKALAAARLKTEKLNTTITPIPMKPILLPSVSDNVDKLFTEPDKKKVNIFKKISNVRNEKLENKIMKIKEEIKQESRENSPVLIIDETEDSANKVHHISNDITIELIDTKPSVNKSPEKTYFHDDSPPGTPLTPKTPEMISHSPPLVKEKRKRKDKSKVKKVQKVASPGRLDQDVMEIDLFRPETPEAQIERQDPFQQLPPTIPFPFPMPTFAGPGLIPPTLANPLFPNLALPLALSNLRKPHFMSAVHTPLPINFMQPVKQEEPTLPPRPKTPVEKIQSPTLALLPAASLVSDSPVVAGEEVAPKLEKKIKEHKKDKKDRIKKKNKKDKIKDKAEKKKLREEKKDKVKVKREKREKKKEKELRENDVSIPKLTLKLGSPSPRPETPDTRKLNIKPIIKKEEEEVTASHEVNRELSPELAKISALVTGQPKPKSLNQTANILISNDNYPTSTDSCNNQVKKTMFKPVPKIRTKEVKREPIDIGLINTPSSYIEELMKEETLVMCPVPRSGPGPGRPRIHPIKPKATKPNKQQIPEKDSEGNEVWICPGCGRQDDGSPMIGCDDCDAWYHWVCVGIQVPPDDNEDWYCRHCLAKNQEVLQTDRKKKRKRREKKEH